MQCDLYTEIEKALTETPWRDPRYNQEYYIRRELVKIVAAKRLKTKAKDNHGHEYDVYLYMENLPTGWCRPDGISDDDFRNTFCFNWVLRIKDTPGGWNMSTLLESSCIETICIDGGQNWFCVNFGDVMREAKPLI